MGAHVGDIGTIIRYTTIPSTDLSAATVLKLKYQKPNGVKGEWPAVVFGIYSAQYVTLLITDLDQTGHWQGQIYAETPGWTGHSEIKKFYVASNL